MTTSRAFELAARRDGVGVQAAATRADWLTVRFRPPEAAERLVSLILTGLIDRLQTEGPGFG